MTITFLPNIIVETQKTITSFRQFDLRIVINFSFIFLHSGKKSRWFTLPTAVLKIDFFVTNADGCSKQVVLYIFNALNSEYSQGQKKTLFPEMPVTRKIFTWATGNLFFLMDFPEIFYFLLWLILLFFVFFNLFYYFACLFVL